MEKRIDLVKKVQRQSLLEEAPLLDGLYLPGVKKNSPQHAALLTCVDAAGEVAALCENGVFG